jgi:hypothetical protein
MNPLMLGFGAADALYPAFKDSPASAGSRASRGAVTRNGMLQTFNEQRKALGLPPLGGDPVVGPMPEQAAAPRSGGGLSGWLQAKAAAADQGGFDEAGFAHMLSQEQPQAAPALPAPQDIPSLPVAPASVMAQAQAPAAAPAAPMAQPQAPQVPQGLLEMLQGLFSGNAGPSPTTGPELISKFMAHLNAAGPGVDAPDQHGLKGW